MTEFLSLPRLSAAVIERPRLIERLGNAAPLTLVRGTFGSGKSVLLIQWATHLERSGRDWVFVDCSCFDGSYAHLLLGIRDRLLGLDAAAALPGEEPLATIHRLLRDRDRPLTVLIDHASKVGNPQAETLLIDLLERYRLLRVVAATRAAAQLGALSLGARLDVTTIGQADLYFTPEETERAIVAITGHPVPPTLGTGLYPSPIVTRIVGLGLAQEHDRLRLAGEPVPAGAPSPELGVLNGEQVAKTLFDLYFNEPEIADVVRSYLLLSFAPAVTRAEAVAITGTEQVDGHLAQAVCDDLGEWALCDGEAEPRFRFAPRWQRLFHGQALIRFGGELGRIKQSLLRIALDSGRYADALEHAVDLGDLDLAARALRAGWTQFTGEATARVYGILQRIGERELEASPVLAYYLALMMFAAAPGPRVGLLLRRVVKTLDRRDVAEEPSEALWAFAVTSTSYRLLGDSGRAARRAHRALAVAERLGAVDRERLGANAPMLLQSCGFSLAAAAELPAAHRALELAEAFASGRYPLASFHGLGHLAALSAMRGEMTATRELLARIDRGAPPAEWTESYFGAGFRVARSLDALERLDPAAAAAELDRVRPHVPGMEHWVQFSVADALTQICLGRSPEALTRIDVALGTDRMPPPSADGRSSLLIVRALAILATGRVTAAITQLGEVPKNSGTRAAVLGLAHLLAERPERAKAVLREVVDPASLWRRSRNNAVGLLLSAAASLRLGHREVARDGAEEALAVMRSTQGLMPMLFTPRADLVALADLVGEEDRAMVQGFLDRDPATTDLLRASQPTVTLTKRERLLLAELTRGDPIPSLATRLRVSPNTVKAQLRTLYRKLGVSSRADAVRRATETGLFD